MLYHDKPLSFHSSTSWFKLSHSQTVSLHPLMCSLSPRQIVAVRNLLRWRPAPAPSPQKAEASIPRRPIFRSTSSFFLVFLRDVGPYELFMSCDLSLPLKVHQRTSRRPKSLLACAALWLRFVWSASNLLQKSERFLS